MEGKIVIVIVVGAWKVKSVARRGRPTNSAMDILSDTSQRLLSCLSSASVIPLHLKSHPLLPLQAATQ